MTERAEPLSERWREELVARLRAILGQLKNGDDAPPAQRFKAEGFAEAGLAPVSYTHLTLPTSDLV